MSRVLESSFAGEEELITHSRVEETIARLLTGQVDVAEECDLIWAAAREGEVDFLYALACELERSEAMRTSPLGMIGAICSLVSEIEQAIVTVPGVDAVEVLFELANLEQRNSLSHAPGRVDRRRLFTSRLVLNQPRQAILEVMARHEEDRRMEPLLFLLVQELVVQGYQKESPLLERLRERMCACGHPLGWLPLRLSELEPLRADPRRTRTVHQYKVYASKVQAPWGPCPARAAAASTDEPKGSQIRNWETTTGDELARISSAVQSWRAESKAKVEARTFALSTDVAAEEINRNLLFRLHTFRALDLPKGPQDFSHEPLTPEQTFAILFTAAANGGELNEGCFGAYGRLRAWQSMAALAGCQDYASIEEVLERSRETSWFYFTARSRWFYGIGEEFGLLALRPGGRTLALLAATDTD